MYLPVILTVPESEPLSFINGNDLKIIHRDRINLVITRQGNLVSSFPRYVSIKYMGSSAVISNLCLCSSVRKFRGYLVPVESTVILSEWSFSRI